MSLKKRLAINYIRAKFKLLSSLSKRKAAEQALQLFFTPQHRNTKKLPPVFEKAAKLHFHLEGETIRGYRWHPSPKKVLIIHGFESSVINFDRYIQPLIKKGYEVLAFDAPAHGRSTGKMINALLYKSFLQHIYKQYGPIQSYIAHSLGGLALSLFLEELKSNEPIKAVLIAPATETTTAIDQAFDYVKLDSEVRKEFDLLIEEISGHPPEWFSIKRAVQHTNADILWVHDKDDNMTPIADADKVRQLHLPNIRFFITEGLGHRRIYRDPKIAQAVVDFL